MWQRQEPLAAAASAKWYIEAILPSRLTLCCRENEAKRSFCKACRALRWDWQLHARLAAILQHRDLHALSLQQVQGISHSSGRKILVLSTL